MLRVLGIHTNVSPNETSPTAGHAWLSLHFDNGHMTTIGLWQSLGTSGFGDLGENIAIGAFVRTFDINVGKEVDPKKAQFYIARESRYYGLPPSIAAHAFPILLTNPEWRYNHTCAGWAEEKVKALTGEDPSSTDLGLLETPRGLARSIQLLEAKDPTSEQYPRTVLSSPI